MEAFPSFWSRLSSATSHPLQPRGHRSKCLPVAKHSQMVRKVLSGHQRRVRLPGPWARRHAGKHVCQRHPAAQGHPLGQMAGDQRWRTCPLPALKRCLNASTPQGTAGPRESCPGPQDTVGGWQEQGCSPVGCGCCRGADRRPFTPMGCQAPPSSRGEGSRGSPGRHPLYRWQQPSWAGCVRGDSVPLRFAGGTLHKEGNRLCQPGVGASAENTTTRVPLCVGAVVCWRWG